MTEADMEKTIEQLITRVEALEERYAFAEATVEQLNTVIISQQGNIEQLQRLLQQLTEVLKSLPLATHAGEEPPPPHY
jgi:SlyX protein